MSTIPPVINFPRWIEEHEHLLKPPVNNRQVWEPMGDFIVQVVGGPNERTDFHVDPYEEWFYQVKGDIHVNLRTDAGIERVDIREGEMWMLPRNVPHSPQRPEPGSIGVVIERIREEGTLEKFQWYCPNCLALVHEVELQVRDIVKDMPPVFAEFYESRDERSCRACGTYHPGRG
ncbi:3-hydroxyanthranilate 3,4-dioxygenase [Streptomyces varsoviensis]|uniref:3-hydroxyanthranilate 3,4-dioxygenase n=1 Tax=Streptomyces varsoviensis TaxID=67373 RepID=A0ABR5JCV2_9ACTN|nr:3-hydroxyanthranilate 3,4-dioxygenase [Streptomyces varsoviensis]KOG91221.1 3-hydroxyanthranilate 3,4-dioxygenase [Streptomyces varsoviensis]